MENYMSICAENDIVCNASSYIELECEKTKQPKVTRFMAPLLWHYVILIRVVLTSKEGYPPVGGLLRAIQLSQPRACNCYSNPLVYWQLVQDGKNARRTKRRRCTGKRGPLKQDLGWSDRDTYECKFGWSADSAL